jgi:hypothetical protein
LLDAAMAKASPTRKAMFRFWNRVDSSTYQAQQQGG